MNPLLQADREHPLDEVPTPVILPLQFGDRLTREEFERRYEVTPNSKKAELIDGRVYMTPPVSQDFHSRPQFDLIGWLSFYRALTPGTEGGDNVSIRLDADNEPQPDACLLILPERGGQSRKDGPYIVGAPELIVEIAASSVSYDLHDKLHVYRRSGVQEYIVWRVLDGEVDWFVLNEGRYDRLPQTTEGHLQSRIFPGLWLDPKALLAGDMQQVMRILQSGCAAPEHTAFVAKLESHK